MSPARRIRAHAGGGLRLFGGRVDLDLAADGSVTVLQAPAGTVVRVHE